MTWSLIARDGSGAIGIAVATRFFACGSLVVHIGRRAAVATQAFVNPVWGTEGLTRLEAGQDAATVIADLAVRDAGAAQRQAHMIDAQGRIAVHTGSDCVDWAGHLTGDDWSVAGNMLAGPQVVAETAQVFAERRDLDLPQRMLTAMEAGEAAGGDKRGRQSAALRIHRGEAHPWLDLRADDHSDPLAELRRLLAVAGERYLIMARALPTEARFSGAPDRSGIDREIAEAEERRRAEGRISASFATSGA
ncbi:DUF1028 domain-containing protein [Paracoccus sp. (in: a-proteobacteria)]|uniref:DUF1028 domain-containing protein n=1 Tax=Paracoccus sp. TaxID=267 RepID=UPI003A8AEA37